MAARNVRYYESAGRMVQVHTVQFKNKSRKRQHVTFKTEEAAEYFLQEIIKREQIWKADELLSEIEGTC